MSWVKLDDQFFRHPKVIEAGRDARDLYLASLCYCAAALTDGVISQRVLAVLATDAGVSHPTQLAAHLVAVGLWDAVPTGYQIHDWIRCSIVRGDDASPARKLWDRLRPGVAPVILARDGYCCQYCGAINNLSIDHILPLSRGGSNDLANLIVACMPCNNAKHARTSEEWLT